MAADAVDLDALIGAWRSAFHAAETALLAAGRDHDLPAAELGARLRDLSAERGATVDALGWLARDRHTRPLLVRLVTSPREAKELLGLPDDVAACIFNVDGVLVASATIHADAWQETFDEFIATRIERTGGSFAFFNRAVDYGALIHGKSSEAAVRDFLASRGISLPEGAPTDGQQAETVRGLARRKSAALRDCLEQHGVNAFSGARLFLELAHDARLPCAVVSGSTHTTLLLERTRLDGLVDVCVDGRTARAEGLERKPAPDMLLAACRSLDVPPARTAVFETTRDGIRAGRAGGFGFVVAVDQEGQGEALRSEGAQLVVADLGEILEGALRS